jgi:signal transduction histidine kinase
VIREHTIDRVTVEPQAAPMAAALNHELRAPLHAIVGSISALEGRLPEGSADRVHIERLKRNSRHLTAMLDDVLDFLSAESNRFSVSPAPLRLCPVIQEALADVEWRADAKGVAVVVATPTSADPVAWGDERRVRQILVNLLTNAVKFTPPAGRITVECGVSECAPGAAITATRSCTYISVADTGRGIPADRMSAIFEPFQQVELSDRGLGTGLGLSISREFARAMNGDIIAASTVGVGSTFTLRLRCGATELAA